MESRSLGAAEIVVLLGFAAGLDRVAIRDALDERDELVDSASEIAALSGLYSLRDHRVFRTALFDLLKGAGRFVYPPQHLGPREGVVTGLDAVRDLEAKAQGLRLIGNIHRPLWVWPMPGSASRGIGLVPLHPSCPLLLEREPRFYQIVALADALRSAQPRERVRAREVLAHTYASAA